jgi:hypothetical protein
LIITYTKMAFDRKANRKRYYLENRDKETSAALKRYYDNREESIQKHKEYLKNNAGKVNEQRRLRYRSDPVYRLQATLRSRFTKAVKRSMKYGSAIDLLGCSVEELKLHIESQFKAGMSWENWSYRGWHIDHIIPITFFDLNDFKQRKSAFHHTNLQPMWGVENMKKSNKINA